MEPIDPLLLSRRVARARCDGLDPAELRSPRWIHDPRTQDNHRQEGFERSRMVVCRGTGEDRRDRFRTAARILAARRDAARESERPWTLTKPSWWPTWHHAHRWD